MRSVHPLARDTQGDFPESQARQVNRPKRVVTEGCRERRTTGVSEALSTRADVSTTRKGIIRRNSLCVPVFGAGGFIFWITNSLMKSSTLRFMISFIDPPTLRIRGILKISCYFTSGKLYMNHFGARKTAQICSFYL